MQVLRAERCFYPIPTAWMISSEQRGEKAFDKGWNVVLPVRKHNFFLWRWVLIYIHGKHEVSSAKPAHGSMFNQCNTLHAAASWHDALLYPPAAWAKLQHTHPSAATDNRRTQRNPWAPAPKTRLHWQRVAKITSCSQHSTAGCYFSEVQHIFQPGELLLISRAGQQARGEGKDQTINAHL